VSLARHRLPLRTPGNLLQQRLFNSPERVEQHAIEEESWVHHQCSFNDSLPPDFLNVLVAAVRLELQKDVEALSSSTSSHLHSWLSEEVAFARDSILEEKKAQSAEIEELRESLRQHEFRWQQECTRRDEDLKSLLASSADFKSVLTFGAPSRPNSADEARMLAEERKWRLKLEGIEDRLQHQKEMGEGLQRQLEEGLEKVTSQVHAASESWGLQSTRLQDDIASLRTCISSEVEQIRGDFWLQVDSATNGFEAKLAGKCDQAELMMCADRVQELSNNLSELLAGEDRVAGQMAALNELAKMWDVEGSRFLNFKTEVDSALAEKASASDLSESVAAISNWMEEMRTELLKWSEQEQQRTNSELAGAREALSSQEAVLNRLWHWSEEVQGREENLAQVLLHIVEQGSPRQLDLFEEALSVPQLAFARHQD